jgi:hypothetical protein
MPRKFSVIRRTARLLARQGITDLRCEAAWNLSPSNRNVEAVSSCVVREAVAFTRQRCHRNSMRREG